MAKTYTKTFYPQAATSSDNWSNYNYVLTSGTSSYATIKGSFAVTYHITVGWSTSLFKELPNDATISNLKIKITAKAESGTGSAWIIRYQPEIPTGSFNQGDLKYEDTWSNGDENYCFTQSFKTIDLNLSNTPTLKELQTNGFVAAPGVTTKRLLGSNLYVAEIFLEVTYSVPDYTITLDQTEGGTIYGGGTFESGTPISIWASENPGYEFVSWSDGYTGNPRPVTVLSDMTFSAIFRKISYITYDSVFNYQKWKNDGINANNGVVSNITDTGFTLTSNAGVSEGTAQSPVFPVVAGESYKIDIDITGSKWDVYIFFYDSNTTSGLGIDFADGATRRFSDGFNRNASFTAPAGATQAAIRVDANGAENTVSFNNFRIYPSNYPYMSNSVLAENRVNSGSWNMPIPTRNNYTFTGWNTKEDGSGITYTSESEFPSLDTALYSQWIKNPDTETLNKILIGNQQPQKIYVGKQLVKTIYVNKIKVFESN